jgi:asparagine synthase (glutamine-hydrolysing)
MCGILAILNVDAEPVDAELLLRMRDEMYHRGPDDGGFLVDGPVGLGHRRLSIIDLSAAGHQPMCNEDGTVWLVFNGEIYNYVELGRELRARGHRFRSETDSEVILHLYEELGEACVERLNGMFAFAIWDTRRRVLFGARDRIGIKPLIYAQSGRRFVCASEAKAILADPAFAREPDWEGLAGWLFCGAPLGGRTVFRGLNELQPGHAFRVVDGRLSTWRYWDLSFDYDRRRSDDVVVEAVADLIEDAVRIHNRSDAALGCHLSGGLDSSTVVALTSRFRKPLRTFSIRFDGGPFFDETTYARAVAAHVGASYLEATPTHADFEHLLPALIWHMDSPLMGVSAFSYYTVSRLAADHVKVSMTGHGGDEVFAGYPAQFQAAFGHTDMFDFATRPSLRPSLTRRLRLAVARYGLAGTALRALGVRREPARPSPGALEQQWIGSHCSEHPSQDPLLGPTLRDALGGYDPVDEYLQPLRDAPTPEVLDRCLYHDLRFYLPTLLHAEDRVSMAVSLESRVPLLDHRIVELMATVPPLQKVLDMEPKALLRRAARRWLPPVVAERRDKGPFPVPIGRWLSGELAPFVRGVLRAEPTASRGVYGRRALRSGLVEQGAAWTALNLELWFRIHIDRDAEWIERVERGRRSMMVEGRTEP